MAATKSHDDENGALLLQLCDNLTLRCRVRQGTRLLVAVSGGADSVALLRLLATAAPRQSWLLEVAHFDHGLRPDSQADAAFVQELAESLELPVHVGHWSKPQRSENAARLARFDYLEETARRQRCGVIVLGHHLDDQIETVLMRLARGSGPRGLLGMAWRRHGQVDFVRPLLDCPRSRLSGFLETIGQAWREDSSNLDTHYLRNRVRQRALPALEASLGPGWQEHWSASIEDQRAQWNWIESQSRSLLERARRRRHRTDPETRLETCALQPLKEAPEPLIRVALQLWLESAGAHDLRRSHVLEAESLVRNGQTGQRLLFPGGVRLHRERHQLLIDKVDEAAAARSAARLERIQKSSKSTGYRLESETVETPAAARIVEAQRRIRTSPAADPAEPPLQLPGATETLVSADALGAHLTVRAARPGERLRLLGAPGQRRVVRILQDHQIPTRLRESWPVVADDEGIVWIPGAGVAERCRLSPSSLSALRLRLTREKAARTPNRRDS